MREGHLLELEGVPGDFGTRQRVLPEDRVLGQMRVVARLEHSQINDPFERGQRTQNGAKLRPSIEGLAAVVVSVDDECELGRQLQKSVDDTARSEVRAA